MTTTTTTRYKFELVSGDGITLQKQVETVVRNARGSRNYEKSGTEREDLLVLTPAQVALVIESGADCLSYVLKDVGIEDGYTVLTKHGEEQD